LLGYFGTTYKNDQNFQLKWNEISTKLIS
jgi:hypothetical protein